jgi:hypothetical protein
MTTEEFTKHYIAAIYFTETGDADQPEQDAELTPLCKAHCWADCRNFLLAYRSLIEASGASLDQAAHDLWLTRNGHGAGFWDRPEIYGQELADELTRVAQAMGSYDAEFTTKEETTQ